MRDTVWDGKVQKMMTDAGLQKRMKTVLEERGVTTREYEVCRSYCIKTLYYYIILRDVGTTLDNCHVHPVPSQNRYMLSTASQACP